VLAPPQDFVVTVDHRTVAIHLEGDRVIIDGKPASASLEKVSQNLYSLLLGNRSYELVISEGTVVSIDGQPVALDVKDMRALLLEKYGAQSGSSQQAQSLRAPMPGLVLRVSVEPGEAVQAGQSALVLEAMKMENDLRIAADGVVRQVHVSPGDAVAKNALLIDFEAP